MLTRAQKKIKEKEKMPLDDEASYTEEVAREVYTSINPKIFSGKTDESIEDFLKHFRRAAKANRWSEETKLLQLPCYLTGPALDFFETIEDSCVDFDNAAEKLTISFKSATKTQQSYYKLMTRRQGVREDVWDYYHEMLKLCHDVNQRMTEAEKVDFILRGLKSNFLEKVNLMENGSLEKLRDNIRRVEATEFMIDVGSSKPGSSRTDNQPQDPEIQRLVERIQQLENRTGRSNIHYRQSYKSQKINPLVIKKESRTPEGKIICFKCNRTGHYARNCFSKN